MKSQTHSRATNLGTSQKAFALAPGPLPRLRLKGILVPVDFSASSQKAVQYAVALAAQFGAEVTLLHVLEPAPAQFQIMEEALTDTSFRQEATEQLSQWQKEVLRGARCVKAEVRDGAVAADEIVRMAKEHDVDLIVMGNRGRTGLARALIGSTAEKVVRHAPCPVLVVRHQEHDFLTEGEAEPR